MEKVETEILDILPQIFLHSSMVLRAINEDEFENRIDQMMALNKEEISTLDMAKEIEKQQDVIMLQHFDFSDPYYNFSLRPILMSALHNFKNKDHAATEFEGKKFDLIAPQESEKMFVFNLTSTLPHSTIRFNEKASTTFVKNVSSITDTSKNVTQKKLYLIPEDSRWFGPYSDDPEQKRVLFQSRGGSDDKIGFNLLLVQNTEILIENVQSGDKLSLVEKNCSYYEYDDIYDREID